MASLICDLDIIADCCVYGVKTPSEDGRCGMAAIVLKPGVTHDKGTDSFISYGILCYILDISIIQLFDASMTSVTCIHRQACFIMCASNHLVSSGNIEFVFTI